MEYRDLILNEKATTYQVIDADMEYFQSIYDDLIDKSLPVADKWKEIILLKAEQKMDCYFSKIEDFDCFLVSARAKDLLTPFMSECDIEFLPCKTEEGNYYILNIIYLIEDLIMDEVSEFEKSEQGIITGITNLVFYFEAIENKSIFKIKELPYVFFVSEDFEEFCIKHDLTGLDFSEDNPFIAADFV